MKNEKEKKEDNTDQRNNRLEEEDFYFNEDGLLVFTRTYHLKRGYCCKNKCKHCPYNSW